MPNDEALIAAITEHQPVSFHKLCSLWDIDWDGDPNDLSVWNARQRLKRQLQKLRKAERIQSNGDQRWRVCNA